MHTDHLGIPGKGLVVSGFGYRTLIGREGVGSKGLPGLLDFRTQELDTPCKP